MKGIEISRESLKNFSHDKDVVNVTQEELLPKRDIVSDKINTLRRYLKRNGMELRFRNTKTMAGDFCIFLYDKSMQSRYLVGYDGSWDKDNKGFLECINQVYGYIFGYLKGKGSKSASVNIG